MFLFGLLNITEQLYMDKCEKYGVEIELECLCMYSYRIHTESNKGIPIGLLRTAFFYMQNIQNTL